MQAHGPVDVQDVLPLLFPPALGRRAPPSAGISLRDGALGAVAVPIAGLSGQFGQLTGAHQALPKFQTGTELGVVPIRLGLASGDLVGQARTGERQAGAQPHGVPVARGHVAVGIAWGWLPGHEKRLQFMVTAVAP